MRRDPGSDWQRKSRARPGLNPQSRRSIVQPYGPLAGCADIHSLGARLARAAAAAAEGGAKRKMADKTPGGSQKASSKVIS